MSYSGDRGHRLHPGGIVPVDAIDKGSQENLEWLTSSTLCIVVIGASGDLAKKKTFPSLLNLYDDNLLPKHTRIYGYARSKMSSEELRDRLRPYLKKTDHLEQVVERFLQRCVYQSGTSYGDLDAFASLNEKMQQFEQCYQDEMNHANRLFYFAIPPNAFAETAVAIKQTCMQEEDKGWTRLIVEKPFGRDLESFDELNKTLAMHFTEQHIYRIDHYLGKEMVQNLNVLRFSNLWFERVWNEHSIQCVMLTFKEPFGTEGRGGYFDKYGIIRDILQNHLLQVLTLLAMETPTQVEGPRAGTAIRDAKVAVLNAINPISIKDVILGQYEGYAGDPTIENKGTNTPTFAMIHLEVNTPRWAGVPFILKAGKALNEHKAEMRIQFKDPPAGGFLFPGCANCTPRNELVMRMQPHEAIYIKTNVKSPGFTAKPIQSELEINYDTRFFAHQKESNPDAYTRLILDVLRGKQAAFVRDDELRRSWEIFTPLLHQIDNEGIRPIIYRKGTRGPDEADRFVFERAGYIRNEDYVFYEGSVARKTEGFDTIPITLGGPKVSVDAGQLCDVGLYGLAVMGQNFALNMAEHGFKVCVGNRTASKVDMTIQRAKAEGNLPIVPSSGPEDFVAHLKKPRKIIILVQAGKPADDTISTLARYMEQGDILVDGGNEWFPNSIRRAEFLKPKGIHFFGMGISGGEEGARKGPSLMPGGPKLAYSLIEPILKKSAAQVERAGPCVSYLGPIGSGNYVKMVHNGIEYGDMQLIAEVYDIMKNLLNMSNEEIASLFDEWQQGELSSYLIDITSTILRKKEDTGEGYVVDYILDKTGMKGTGMWTIKEGAEKSVAIPTMAAALDARMLSCQKEEREAAAKIFFDLKISDVKKETVIEDLRAALYASKVCSYAQGLGLIRAASDEYGWDIDLAECARIWMGGCIIRAKLLDHIQSAFSENNRLANLLVDPFFSAQIIDRVPAWRRLVAMCVSSGIACPSLCSSLTYFDTYRRGRLPANLTQAQRDFFGGHTYERVDRPGRFHTAWTNAHNDIGDANQRTAGENLQT